MGEIIRASDAERNAAVEQLSTALTEGRLTLEEFDERLEAALAATHRDQLAELTADIPANPAPSVLAVPGGLGMQQSSVFGDIVRAGGWQVPEQGGWRTIFGDVELDLRQARVNSMVVHLDTRTIFGDVKLRVPAGVEVDVQCSTVFGDVRQDTAEPYPGAPRVVLTGRCFFGDIRVRDDRPRESRWRRWLGLPPAQS